ncbi:hypothetical protein [Micropruina sp.]|uniref:hypothetical protein n=1 Tax=Micropruina sp. TaxID=2737536 RepID=UPI0039E658C1
MLKWDKVETINGLSVYADDTDANTWYALPQTPRFRIDNGKPVFRFIKYKFPIEHSSGKKGGGFLICDVEFGMTPSEEQALREVLQERVTTRWFGAGDPPKAKIGQLSFTRGAASVQIVDAGGELVQKVTNPASPSLYGKMVLPITVELSPEGATLLEQALQGDGGIVQVAYDLWTPVKLPDVSAHVWFDLSKTMHFHQHIDVEERICAEDDYSEAITQIITSSDSGEITIIPGAGTDAKAIDAVTAWATKTMADAATRMVLGDAPLQSPEEIRKLYTEQDFENIDVDFFDHRNAHFDQWFRVGQVMEWNPAPRGTLPNITSMKGPDGKAYEWKNFSTTVDLNDPFFRTMKVSMRVNADFEKLPLHSVELKVAYDPAGQNIVVEPVFTDADGSESMEAFIANNNRFYSYSYQVNYKGETRPYMSAEKTSNDPSLVINVGDLGILHLDVSPGDLNFDQVSAAQVRLWYGEGTDRIETSMSLTNDDPKHNWTKVIFAERRAPVHYQVKYFMADGREFDGPELTTGANELPINDPFASTRTINIRGFGDFAGRIDTIFVDLTYTDSINNYSQTKSVALNAGSTFDEWSFPAILPDGGELSYVVNIRYKDGTVETHPAAPIIGTTVMVGDVQLMQKVDVMADLIDFTAVRLVKVTLRTTEPGVTAATDLVFKSGGLTTQSWEYPYEDAGQRKLDYTIMYFAADGTSASKTVTGSVETTIVLPPNAN